MRNKPCEVRFLPLFEKDLTRVTNYIKYQIHNPIAAINLVDAIEQAIIERAYAPDSFEPYPSKKERNTAYYRIQVKNFEIYYVFVDGIMEVRRLAYKRQNIKDIL